MLLLAAPVVVTLVVLVLPSSRVATAQDAGSGSPTTTTTGRRTVETVYLADCATCHGAEAQGIDGRGPSLEGVGAALVDYELTTGRMPLRQPGDKTVRHDPKYDAPTITALDAYVASLAGGGPQIPVVGNGDVAKGGELFRLQCAACHSWAGNGGALLEREAPSLHSSTPTQIAEAVRTGPGTMPAFGNAALDSRQLDDVVAYVRTLAHPQDRGGFGLWHLGPFIEGAVGWFIALGGVLLGLRWIGTRR